MGTFAGQVRGWMACAGLLGLGAIAPARAALVDLDLYVTYSVLQNNGSTVLADGSWVIIVGSGNAVNDGMMTYGGTNVLANTTQGDDIILGTVYIGDNSFANTGKFFTTVQYNPTNVGYVYIRYFQTTGPLTGMIYWGQSGVANLSPTNFGVVTVDAAPIVSLVATNLNNFVIIPEPNTAHLLFLATAGMLAALRMRRKGGRGPPLRGRRLPPRP